MSSYTSHFKTIFEIRNAIKIPHPHIWNIFVTNCLKVYLSNFSCWSECDICTQGLNYRSPKWNAHNDLWVRKTTYNLFNDILNTRCGIGKVFSRIVNNIVSSASIRKLRSRDFTALRVFLWILYWIMVIIVQRRFRIQFNVERHGNISDRNTEMGWSI